MAFAEAAWNHVRDPKIALPPLELALAEALDAAPELLPRVLYLVGAVYERRGELETIVETAAINIEEWPFKKSSQRSTHTSPD